MRVEKQQQPSLPVRLTWASNCLLKASLGLSGVFPESDSNNFPRTRTDRAPRRAAFWLCRLQPYGCCLKCCISEEVQLLMFSALQRRDVK